MFGPSYAVLVIIVPTKGEDWNERFVYCICYTFNLSFIFSITIIFFEEKSELFLELYGNSLLRSRTTQFVEEIANDLIKLVNNYC